MRMMRQIAKAELRNMFYSPVAWFLTLVFLIQCGYFFTDVLTRATELQDVFLKNNPNYEGDLRPGTTRSIFGFFFTSVLRNVFLFFPLLTMGLIGKEVQQGTYRLLYSSPVKLRQIVFGKYLAIMCYNLLLVLIVGIFMVSAYFCVDQLDYGMLLSALLGFFLLSCAYAAIGTFISSLTTHQIIAAVGTFLIVFSLNSIAGLWQQYDFVRDLTHFLHLPGRATNMLMGLIFSEDIVYFLVIVGFFLGFTIFRLKAAREGKPWFVSALRYSGTLIIGLLIGYISSRPIFTRYWDTTALKLNTIHEKTQRILAEMGEEPLEVTLYTNYFGIGAGAGLPVNRNPYLHQVWQPYLRFKPDIKFNYVYYYDYDSTIMGNRLGRTFQGKTLHEIFLHSTGYTELDTSGFLKPVEMRKQIDLRPENLRLVMQLKYKGRSEFLRTMDDIQFWPDERNIAAVLKKLVIGNGSKIAFVEGHYERNIHKTGLLEYGKSTGLKTERIALINHGFEVDTISLDVQDIPQDLATLVLADPKSELCPVCQTKIKDYINRGGNLIVLGEPGKQHFVNPILKQLGVQLMDGVLVTQHPKEMPDRIVPFATEQFANLIDLVADNPPDKKQERFPIIMPRATAIDFTDTAGYSCVPLLQLSTQNSWLKKGKLVVDSALVEFNMEEGDLRNYTPSVPFVQTNPLDKHTSDTIQQHQADGHIQAQDKATTFVSLLALHRTVNDKEQRILISGDADFISNEYRNNDYYMKYLNSWIIQGGFPIFTPRPYPLDKFYTITGKTAEKLKWFFVWILPGIVLLAAAVLLIRRKRK